jgi:hypothetical protein
VTQDDGAVVQNRRFTATRHSNEKYSPEKIIEAMRASRGMIATAARLLGCSRQTVYDAIARHPEINSVVAGERELMLDNAELKLQEAIDNGESWAIRFYLSTQGQSRGYIERPQVDEDAGKVTVVIRKFSPEMVPDQRPTLPEPSTEG